MLFPPPHTVLTNCDLSKLPVLKFTGPLEEYHWDPSPGFSKSQPKGPLSLWCVIIVCVLRRSVIVRYKINKKDVTPWQFVQREYGR